MMRRRKPLRLILLLAALVLVLAALDQRVVLRRYTVHTGKLAAPVRLAVLADFHGCDYGENGSRLAEQVESLQPDAILMAGDMFSSDGDPAEELAMFRTLQSIAPCYYVTGNHEYWEYHVPDLLEEIGETGVTVLDQTCVTVQLNGNPVNLCGIPDPYAGGQTAEYLLSALRNADAQACTVLLAHRPELMDTYAAAGGVDLVVTGHAHGGQVRIPFLVNGLCAPNQGFFPRYAGGLYQQGGTTMIVSRGLSTQLQMGVPRLFNRPELLLVELQ